MSSKSERAGSVSFLDHLAQSSKAQKVDHEEREREEEIYRAYEAGEIVRVRGIDQERAREAVASDMEEDERAAPEEDLSIGVVQEIREEDADKQRGPIARVKPVNRPRKVKAVDPKRPFMTLPEETVLVEASTSDGGIDDSVDMVHNPSVRKAVEQAGINLEGLGIYLSDKSPRIEKQSK